jgi:hypothetical protein
MTENGDVALPDLRQPKKPHELWVDAMCMDRTSAPERRQQVRLMADVYKLARRVIIYGLFWPSNCLDVPPF